MEGEGEGAAVGEACCESGILDLRAVEDEWVEVAEQRRLPSLF